MLRSFKNLELFRYYVANSIEKNIRFFIKKMNKNRFSLLALFFQRRFRLLLLL